MGEKTFFARASVFALLGLVFSGYLSGVKLFSGACAFSEPCPYFLGYPACWYGFALFLALMVLALLGRAGRLKAGAAAQGILGVAVAGTLFAGAFVAQELFGWFAAGHASFYGFGLPTCVYGLVFYLILLVLSARFLARPRTPPSQG